MAMVLVTGIRFSDRHWIPDGISKECFPTISKFNYIFSSNLISDTLQVLALFHHVQKILIEDVLASRLVFPFRNFASRICHFDFNGAVWFLHQIKIPFEHWRSWPVKFLGKCLVKGTKIFPEGKTKAIAMYDKDTNIGNTLLTFQSIWRLQNKLNSCKKARDCIGWDGFI